MNAIDPLPPEPQDKSKAPAVDGALDILEVLIRSTYPLSLSEIAERVGMPVVNCHRIVGALVRRELVVRDLLRRKSYGVGAKLFQTVSAAYFQQPVVSLFHSIADVLKNELHEAVHLSIPAGSQALVVAHVSCAVRGARRCLCRQVARATSGCGGQGDDEHAAGVRAEALLGSVRCRGCGCRRAAVDRSRRLAARSGGNQANRLRAGPGRRRPGDRRARRGPDGLTPVRHTADSVDLATVGPA
ncbi:helix-turn-helix domain-containing protein [Burkholderia contaminans]|uniref:HTH iclR-type domain-containing protein n=1 Tax=Burkholderia contaminans TaxID=488447 RepID=A0A3N8PTS5_9BURK|nr:hypothetical protein DF051_17645 [Burkholderia contaminans]